VRRQSIHNNHFPRNYVRVDRAGEYRQAMTRWVKKKTSIIGNLSSMYFVEFGTLFKARADNHVSQDCLNLFLSFERLPCLLIEANFVKWSQ